MSRINRVVFFVEFNFSESHYRQFGIETLVKNGFDVEVWDFTPFLANDEYQKIKLPDPVNWNKYYRFRSRKEAVAACLNLPDSCYIVAYIHYTICTYHIFKALSRKGLNYVIPGFALPISTTKREFVVKRVKRFRPKKILPWLFKAIPYKLLGIRPAHMVMAVGEKYTTTTFPVDEKTHILWVHSSDYDAYLDETKQPVDVDAKMGVFLDEYIPFHPDGAYIGFKPLVDPDEYYPALCKFFSLLEKKYGMHIVIAVHPRSNYDDHPDYFDGRPLIRGATARLVRQSRFVLLHHSMALYFAVLFERPMIFLTSHKLSTGLHEDPSIEWLADYFGKKAYDLDKDEENDNINFEEELKIDKKAYDVFRNAHIKKSGSQELPSWQIFANRLKEVR